MLLAPPSSSRRSFPSPSAFAITWSAGIPWIMELRTTAATVMGASRINRLTGTLPSLSARGVQSSHSAESFACSIDRSAACRSARSESVVVVVVFRVLVFIVSFLWSSLGGMPRNALPCAAVRKGAKAGQKHTPDIQSGLIIQAKSERQRLFYW